MDPALAMFECVALLHDPAQVGDDVLDFGILALGFQPVEARLPRCFQQTLKDPALDKVRRLLFVNPGVRLVDVEPSLCWFPENLVFKREQASPKRLAQRGKIAPLVSVERMPITSPQLLFTLGYLILRLLPRQHYVGRPQNRVEG